MKYQFPFPITTPAHELHLWINRFSASGAGGRFTQLKPYRAELAPEGHITIQMKLGLEQEYIHLATAVSDASHDTLSFIVDTDDKKYWAGGRDALIELLTNMIQDGLIRDLASSFVPDVRALITEAETHPLSDGTTSGSASSKLSEKEQRQLEIVRQAEHAKTAGIPYEQFCSQRGNDPPPRTLRSWRKKFNDRGLR